MLGQIYDYFIYHMDALGYREHESSFGVSDLAGNVLDRSYHLDVSPGTGAVQQMDQDAVKTQSNVVLRIFREGFNRERSAKQSALDEMSLVMATLLVSRNKLDNPFGIMDVKLSAYSLTPLSGDAEHSLVLEFQFNVEYYLDFVEILNL